MLSVAVYRGILKLCVLVDGAGLEREGVSPMKQLIAVTMGLGLSLGIVTSANAAQVLVRVLQESDPVSSTLAAALSVLGAALA